MLMFVWWILLFKCVGKVVEFCGVGRLICCNVKLSWLIVLISVVIGVCIGFVNVLFNCWKLLLFFSV